jgi:hypothetical protein
MGNFGQVASSTASATNFEMFLTHRPQQVFLSLSPRESASFLGQVIAACPNSRTSDSLMPLQMQMYTRTPVNKLPLTLK